MDYQGMIAAHARSLGARIHFIQTIEHSRSDIVSRVLYITRADDEMQYWVAMHELGHIATTSRNLVFPDSLQITDSEATAWAWAIDNADVPIDDTARSAIAAGMASYLRVALSYSGDVQKVVKTVGEQVDWENLPFSFSRDEAADNVWTWKNEWSLINER